ncbi:MAG TPA: IS30 family transposase [Coxiellaceae bacterium]|nr:IS30 family transposase [Coxiellaceae bacterium]
MGLSVNEMATKLSRNRATIYRELNRNKESETYSLGIAQQKIKERNKERKQSKLETDGVLRDYVITGLKKGWSPEQISGRMKCQKLSFYVCHETIYQFIYRSKNKELYHCLVYKKPHRQRRYERHKQSCRYGDIRLIKQRPEEINSRKRFGHWEGDTIQFSEAREKVVTTLVERKSRVVYLIKNQRKHSRGVMNKITEKFENLPNKMCKTITFDQGIEFADYRHLEQQIQCKVYYCETHSPWQKGSNENMNGRLRRYLPRETEIAKIAQSQLDELATKMNRCPRKCLGFKTPNELFIRQYKNDCRTWS